MDLQSLTREHVLAAIREIDRGGVPERRRATKFALVFGDNAYPPKYVLSVATRHATGRELSPQDFSGGTETNTLLGSLGFEIRGPDGKRVPMAAPVSARRPTTPMPPTRSSRQRTASVARLVAIGRTPDSPQSLERMVLDALGALDHETTFLVTPGGFARTQFPRGWQGSLGWSSQPRELRPLTDAAAAFLARVVTPRVVSRASGLVRVVTLGIDLADADSDAHVELVAAYDVAKGRIVRWTGKSYPTSGQQASLVQVVDLDSHLLEIAGERVLLLGCHDLNMWSPRGRANQSPDSVRRVRCDEMRRAARAFQPSVVLQHPHSTDTANIWAVAWSGVRRELPTVMTWASGVGYYARSGRPRARLDAVLARTRGEGENYQDVVLRSADYA